jgi:hypothetical protein
MTIPTERILQAFPQLTEQQAEKIISDHKKAWEEYGSSPSEVAGIIDDYTNMVCSAPFDRVERLLTLN